MKEFKKEYKKLWKVYNSKLNKLHKANFESMANNLNYFVTYLRFLRDYYILTEPLEIDNKENEKIASIATALLEYDSYSLCKNKYFKEENGKIKYLVEGAEEEIMKKYKQERDSHWMRFWQIVAYNIQEWTGKNVTVQ